MPQSHPLARSEDEAAICRCIEQVTGGSVISMERQLRWRPAWFANVEAGGKRLPIHVRGERTGDVAPFPELQREADILAILEDGGIPVPHVFGVCKDPSAIIMDNVPGTRDLTQAHSDEERRAIARQYIELLVAMHRLPLEPFAEKGISVPRGPEAIALAGLEAYLPVYQRNKARPEPLIEFAIRWLRANVPMHRTRPSFTQFDAGQFLFENGKITALYDFEFAMITDPLVDLATMRMRESIEPTGDEMRNLFRYYEELSGEPLDVSVIQYYTVLFSTVACMQFSGTVPNPVPGDPHDVYLEWDLALRRSLTHALAEAEGISIEPTITPEEQPGPDASMFWMLKDTLERITPADGLSETAKRGALGLLECLTRSDAMSAGLHQRTWSEGVAILGREPANWAAFHAELEASVRQVEPADYARLIHFFLSESERRVKVYETTTIGHSARNAILPPIV